jgi:hypothetical protein
MQPSVVDAWYIVPFDKALMSCCSHTCVDGIMCSQLSSSVWLSLVVYCYCNLVVPDWYAKLCLTGMSEKAKQDSNSCNNVCVPPSSVNCLREAQPAEDRVHTLLFRCFAWPTSVEVPAPRQASNTCAHYNHTEPKGVLKLSSGPVDCVQYNTGVMMMMLHQLRHGTTSQPWRG